MKRKIHKFRSFEQFALTFRAHSADQQEKIVGAGKELLMPFALPYGY